MQIANKYFCLAILSGRSDLRYGTIVLKWWRKIILELSLWAQYQSWDNWAIGIIHAGRKKAFHYAIGPKTFIFMRISESAHAKAEKEHHNRQEVLRSVGLAGKRRI